jgi:hypothetical protein
MKLRIPFYAVHFYPEVIDDSYNNTDIYQLHAGELDYLRIYDLQQQVVNVLDDCGEVISSTTEEVKVLIGWVEDPRDLGVALADIPMLLTECKTILIEAAYTVDLQNGDYNDDYNDDYNTGENSDYNDDYSDDYGSYEASRVGGRRTFTFSNTFAVFGYDLGNNSETRLRDFPNPDFNIYFAINDGDYSHDYNMDYSYIWDTYANIIHYRRPYTNEVYFFDNTSSDYEHIQWWTSLASENIEDCKTIKTYIFSDDYYLHRNGMLCRDDEFVLNVSKTKYDILTEADDKKTCGCSCSCGCSPVQIEMPVEYYEYLDDVNHSVEDFPTFKTLVSPSDEYCSINIASTNRATTYIDYTNKEYYIDDIRRYPYTTDTVLVTLHNKIGDVEQYKTTTSPLQTWNPYLNTFEFNIPLIGDYVIRTNLKSVLDNVTIRECETTVAIENTHWLKFTQGECGTVILDNCGFSPASVNRYKLIEDAKKGLIWSLVYSVVLSPLSNQSIEILEDGIYKYEVARDGEDTVSNFIVITYCKIQACLNQLITDLICNDSICDDRFIYDFTKLNAIIPQWSLMLQKLHSEYINNYVYDTINNTKMAELYKLEIIYNRLVEYCNNCNNLLIKKCGC